MIEFRAVSLVYPNGVRALSGVNARIEKGEFVFLTGPTGAGKSSFLKLIYGELAPAYGEVWANGINVGRISRREVPTLRRKIGVVFQDFKLLDNRTIFENVAYALEVVGGSPREIHRKVSRVLHLVGLSHKANHHVGHLSGGEQQRTAIARALANNPSILLADEPTGQLDPDTGWEIMQLFEKINRDGTTVVTATNNLTWIERLGKRAIFLCDGESIENLEKGANRLAFTNAAVLSS